MADEIQNWVFTLTDLMFVLKINGCEKMKSYPSGYDLSQPVLRLD